MKNPLLIKLLALHLSTYTLYSWAGFYFIEDCNSIYTFFFVLHILTRFPYVIFRWFFLLSRPSWAYHHHHHNHHPLDRWRLSWTLSVAVLLPSLDRHTPPSGRVLSVLRNSHSNVNWSIIWAACMMQKEKYDAKYVTRCSQVVATWNVIWWTILEDRGSSARSVARSLLPKRISQVIWTYMLERNRSSVLNVSNALLTKIIWAHTERTVLPCSTRLHYDRSDSILNLLLYLFCVHISFHINKVELLIDR